MPVRIPTPLGNNNTVPGMQQPMRFNLGTLPYTFMQMGPEGITLNQVSASVVADVQTANSSSPQSQSSTNRPTLRMLLNHKRNENLIVFSKYFLIKTYS